MNNAITPALNSIAEIESRIHDETQKSWPAKVNLFGVDVSVTDYESASDAVIQQAERRQRGLVSCYAVHALVTFSGDPELKRVANQFDMITPDGQPVRWAMNLRYRTNLQDRVYGPELMLRICEKAARKKVSVFLYGGTDESLGMLEGNLKKMFSQIEIVGSYSPPFRPLTDEEHRDVMDSIEECGAQIVFIGLGCPKQDLFAFENRKQIQAVQVCVGAAFDFHAGTKKKAPKWMQKLGMEWLFRLASEPKRLWKRYLVTNSVFLWKLAKSMVVGETRTTVS